MPWNPDRYHQFQVQRSAPFDNLLSLIDIHPGMRVVDLGCGTGELTRRLADSLPDSKVLGLDSSPQMLDRAQGHVRAGLRFATGDQAQLEGEWDLIFSNAALHWSENHTVLIPRLFKRLAQGGQLAIQVPSNHNAPAHVTIAEVAGREPFFSTLAGWARQSPVLSIEAYAELLYREDAQDILVFEKVYPHVLENADAVVDWISGTTLVPYFERLDNRRDDFIHAIRQELRVLFPGEPVFYPFRRIFISARKSA